MSGYALLRCTDIGQIRNHPWQHEPFLNLFQMLLPFIDLCYRLVADFRSLFGHFSLQKSLSQFLFPCVPLEIFSKFHFLYSQNSFQNAAQYFGLSSASLQLRLKTSLGWFFTRIILAIIHKIIFVYRFWALNFDFYSKIFNQSVSSI